MSQSLEWKNASKSLDTAEALVSWKPVSSTMSLAPHMFLVGLLYQLYLLIDELGEKDDTLGKHLPKWHPELPKWGKVCEDLGIFQGSVPQKAPYVRNMKVGEIVTVEFIQYDSPGYISL